MAAGSREMIFPSRRTNWPTLRSPGDTRLPPRTISASSVRATLTRSEPLAIDSCKGQLSIIEAMVPRIALSPIFFTHDVGEGRFLISIECSTWLLAVISPDMTTSAKKPRFSESLPFQRFFCFLTTACHFTHGALSFQAR